MLFMWQSMGPQFAIAFAFMVVLAISVHEMAHAWMAKRCGDDTAERLGRITINPVSHFDPVGFLCVLFAPIGWGKPVPYNPYNLQDMRRDGMYIALAGPVSNIIQAVALAFIFQILNSSMVAGLFTATSLGGALYNAAWIVCFVGVWINLSLAFFNMIPLFPLDGEKILIGLLPYRQAIQVEDFRQYSPMVLMALFMYPFVLPLPSVIHLFIHFTSEPLRRLLIGI